SCMSWRVCLCVSAFIIGIPVCLAAGVYALNDNTCGGTSKVSLEKRCQSAVNYNKARQVNL
ncbi:TPA: hypothetical protein ACS705_003700, partial [Providencia alcalifaciens]